MSLLKLACPLLPPSEQEGIRRAFLATTLQERHTTAAWLAVYLRHEGRSPARVRMALYRGRVSRGDIPKVLHEANTYAARMDNAQLADYLIMGATNDSVKQYTDRLVLRLFDYPALMSRLKKVNTLKDSVELIFAPIPAELIESVKGIIGSEDPIEVFTFKMEGKPCVGFRIKPRGIRDTHESTPNRQSAARRRR